MTDRHSKTTCSKQTANTRALEDLLSGVRSRLLAGALGLGVLVSSCGSPSDSGPVEPVDAPPRVEVGVPDSYPFDVPASHRFSVSDVEGLVDGVVSYSLNGSLVFEREVRGVSRFDTTWTPRPSGPGSSRVEYSFVDDVGGSSSGVEVINVLPNKFVRDTLFVEDFFSGSVVDGFVTFPNESVVRVDSGRAVLGRDTGLLAGSLRDDGFRVLFEGAGFLDYSSVVVGSRPSLRVVPEVFDEPGDSDWSWEKHVPYLNGHVLRGLGEFGTQGLGQTRWRVGSEIEVRLYDESYLVPDASGSMYVASDDPNLLAEREYIDGAVEVYSELESLLNAVGADVSLSFVRESEGDSLPRTLDFDPGVVYISGWPGASFAITSSRKTDAFGYFVSTLQHQRTDPPATFGIGNIRSDGLEHFGPNTTIGGALGVLEIGGRSYKQPFVNRMLELFYAHPTGTGTYELPEALPNKDGGLTKTVEFYVPK